MSETSPQISTDSPRGATVRTMYVERQVKAFAIFETEVNALSSLNAQATVFFSLASATLSFAVGIWTNAAFSANPTAEAKVASQIAAPAFVVLSIVFVGLGVHAWYRRRTTVNSIREQSTAKTE